MNRGENIKQYSLDFETAKNFLPHGEEIKAIGSILSLAQGRISCVTKTPYSEVFCLRSEANELLLSQSCFVEFVAQAAAIGKIMSSSGQEQRPSYGAVLRARGFECSHEAIPNSTALRIDASWGAAVAGAYEVNADIFFAKEPSTKLSSGKLTLMEIK